MSDPALALLRPGAGNRHEQGCDTEHSPRNRCYLASSLRCAGNRHEQGCDTEHSQGRPAAMIFINGSSENCRIQRALLWNRCLAGSLFLFPCLLVSGPQLRDPSSMRWHFPFQVPWVFQFEEGSQRYKPICPEGSFQDGSFARAPEISESRHPEVRTGGRCRRTPRRGVRKIWG